MSEKLLEAGAVLAEPAVEVGHARSQALRLLPRSLPTPGVAAIASHQHGSHHRHVTSVCYESSARDASTLGYRVIMVADANAARRDQDHNATLHTIYRTFGDVRSTTDVIDMIESPAP
jgi:hypothetical protein